MAKILYVEDNFDNYKLVEFILTKSGFSVMNAIDGLDAIEKAEMYNPDLILMDINLPNLKGFEAATLLKSKAKTKDIPIVVLTAAYSNEYKVMAEKLGCAGYFTKPIDPLSFSEDIKKILSKQHESNFDDTLTLELSRSLEEKARKMVHIGKELSKVERKFNSIVEAILDPIILIDLNNIVTFVNSAANNYEFIRRYYKKEFDLRSMINDDSLLEKFNKIGYIKNYIIRIEDFIFIGNFVKLENEVLITLKDITELQKIADKQKEIDKMATIGRIASGVIHEINNPLSALKTYIDILPSRVSRSVEKQAVVDDFTDKMKRSLDKIFDLVTNLTFFARKSSEPEININLNTLIKEVLSFAGYDIRRGNVSVNLKFAEDIPLIRGYKSEIEQAILNLLTNASDAVQGRANPTINIKTYSDDGNVYVEVDDNGPGIPEEIQGSIFEPFFSTKDNEKSTGLGLAIVMNVVKKHFGEVKFFTSESGTKFVLSFPKLDKVGKDGKD
ncbi:MAG: response regulator [Calditerrivibrio sp.]|nr:response regulator [Calditerrivibrio sp.]